MLFSDLDQITTNARGTGFVSTSFTKFNQKKRQFLPPEIHACTLKYLFMKLQEIPSER